MSQQEYYSQSSEITGVWGGRGAARLGLRGEVHVADFARLCDNQHPLSGERLTLRTKNNRTVGYDFNFHPPKSVSIVHTFAQICGIAQADIELAFTRSVDEVMWQMEELVSTRVRKDHRDETRPTANLVWASFTHTTTRPVNGLPDPHLHRHCFVFNATFDKVEDVWKAGYFRELKRQSPYFEAVFQAKLATNLEKLGFGIVRTEKSFEIEGMSPELMAKFSNRTRQIDEEAEARGITTKKAKSKLGMLTREPKRTDKPADLLQAEWESRLSADDRDSLRRLLSREIVPERPGDPKLIAEAIAYAKAYCFERQSVIEEFLFNAAAIRYGLQRLDPIALRQAVRNDPSLIRVEEDGRILVTTPEVVNEERQLVEWVKAGKGACSPLAHGQTLHSGILDADQIKAANHILTSRDRVTGIMGKAGTGKTTLMKATIDAIRAAGIPVAVLAPNADTGRGTLRQAGFPEADTVESFLRSDKRQEELKGGVIWVDEAGLLSIIDVGRIAEVARKINARVVLTGDTAQHRAVRRGDALRILHEHAGLSMATLRNIRRQRDPDYREAVVHLAEGRIEEGYQKLDQMGAIIEIADDATRYDLAGTRYVEELTAGTRFLFVCPTHAESKIATDYIRRHLVAAGHISDERVFPILRRVDMHDIDQSNPRSYEPGMVLEFVRNTPIAKSGDRLLVSACRDGKVFVADRDEKAREIDVRTLAPRFRVYERDQIAVGKGDRIRITRNSRGTATSPSLNNASLHTVTGFTRDGDIRLEDGKLLARDFAHFTHGHVNTSFAAQSKTVEKVFILQSAISFNAASRQQFYVSASRATTKMELLTCDKTALFEAVQVSSDRRAGLDLGRNHGRHHHQEPSIQISSQLGRRAFMPDLRRWGMPRECAGTEATAW